MGNVEENCFQFQFEKFREGAYRPGFFYSFFSSVQVIQKATYLNQLLSEKCIYKEKRSNGNFFSSLRFAFIIRKRTEREQEYFFLIFSSSSCIFIMQLNLINHFPFLCSAEMEYNEIFFFFC